MLRSIIISPNTDLTARLESALTAVGEVTITRKVDLYPSAVDLARIVRAQAPQLVFLSFAASDKAIEIVRFLENDAPGAQVKAVHRQQFVGPDEDNRHHRSLRLDRHVKRSTHKALQATVGRASAFGEDHQWHAFA